MSFAQKAFNVAVVLALIGLAFAAVRPAGDKSLGGSSFYEAYPVQFGNGLQIGSAGTITAKIISGTCNASITSLPVQASSTVTATCAVPNAAAGDKVFVTLPAATPNVFSGFDVQSGGVSAGQISFQFLNNTGAASSSFATATTGVQYLIVK